MVVVELAAVVEAAVAELAAVAGTGSAGAAASAPRPSGEAAGIVLFVTLAGANFASPLSPGNSCADSRKSSRSKWICA